MFLQKRKTRLDGLKVFVCLVQYHDGTGQKLHYGRDPKVKLQLTKSNTKGPSDKKTADDPQGCWREETKEEPLRL